MNNTLIKKIYRHSFTTGYYGKAFNADKFAELIVLECADYLSKLGEFNSAQNIKDHFGVEG